MHGEEAIRYHPVVESPRMRPTNNAAMHQLVLLPQATTAFVPVQFSSMYLADDIAGDTGTLHAQGERHGVSAAYLDLQTLGPNSEILLKIDAFRCISCSSEARPVDKTFSSPFSRLVRKPDTRTLT